MKLFYRNTAVSKGDPRVSRSEETYATFAYLLEKEGQAAYSAFPHLTDEDGEIVYKNVRTRISGIATDTEGNLVLFCDVGTITVIEEVRT